MFGNNPRKSTTTSGIELDPSRSLDLLNRYIEVAKNSFAMVHKQSFQLVGPARELDQQFFASPLILRAIGRAVGSNIVQPTEDQARAFLRELPGKTTEERITALRRGFRDALSATERQVLVRKFGAEAFAAAVPLRAPSQAATSTQGARPMVPPAKVQQRKSSNDDDNSVLQSEDNSETEVDSPRVSSTVSAATSTKDSASVLQISATAAPKLPRPVASAKTTNIPPYVAVRDRKVPAPVETLRYANFLEEESSVLSKLIDFSTALATQKKNASSLFLDVVNEMNVLAKAGDKHQSFIHMVENIVDGDKSKSLGARIGEMIATNDPKDALILCNKILDAAANMAATKDAKAASVANAATSSARIIPVTPAATTAPSATKRHSFIDNSGLNESEKLVAQELLDIMLGMAQRKKGRNDLINVVDRIASDDSNKRLKQAIMAIVSPTEALEANDLVKQVVLKYNYGDNRRHLHDFNQSQYLESFVEKIVKKASNIKQIEQGPQKQSPQPSQLMTQMSTAAASANAAALSGGKPTGAAPTQPPAIIPITRSK